MLRNAWSKTSLNEQNNRDPNARIFSDTSGRVSETYHLQWSRIYAIFDNDDSSTIPHDQSTFVNISKSKLHAIVARTTSMPYTDLVKCMVTQENPKDRSFNDQDHT